jgi:hypothetical protein
MRVTPSRVRIGTFLSTTTWWIGSLAFGSVMVIVLEIWLSPSATLYGRAFV